MITGLLESVDIFNRRINVPPANKAQHLGIEPWNRERLQPASYEISLGSQFRLFNPAVSFINAERPGDYTIPIDVDDNEQEWYDQGYYELRPGEFILGTSVEKFTFPHDLAGELTGRSSIGRMGIQVHSTAGFFDPGFSGTATLEISNIAPVPIRLQPGLIIAQMRFVTLSRPSEWAYGHPERRSHYQGQWGPTPSRLGSRDNIRPIEDVQLQLPGIDWSQYEHAQRRGPGH